MKLSLGILMLILGTFGAVAQAQASVPTSGTTLQLNNLRIANRAQCAVDSEMPTDTAFIVVDGYNAGKLSYSLAKNIGADGAQMSSQGMQDFRIAVSVLTKNIANKLFTGALPMLPLNLKTSKLHQYNALAAKCDKKTYCPELNTYLAKIWDNSEGAGIPWTKIDNFTGSQFLKSKKADRVGCFYVKKFSGLQGNLHTTELDVASLQDMAQSYLNHDKNITACEDRDVSLDSRNSMIQLNLKLDGVGDFNAYGFDFWNSVKIYLSFAWRYSNIPSQVSPHMGELFKSVALEESIMLVPNGCKSIEKPACDSETLSLNSLRELAKPGQNPADSFKENPDGPEKGTVNNGARSVNDDFLGTRGYQEASDWVENFRKNYVENRGSMKNRLQSSIQFLNVLSGAMTAEELNEFVKPMAFAGHYSNTHRDELYYMCTEARLAGDRRLDFMRSGIDRIKQLSVMQKAFEGSPKSLDQMEEYFDRSAAGLVSFCDTLEKQKIWNVDGYVVNREGFNRWAKEILNIPRNKEATGVEFQPMTFGAPLLVWDKSKPTTPSNIICLTGMDCARKLTKAMVDLYAVSKYADAFLPVSSTVSSPDIFNPYADLKACKIYDPWFQTRRANKRLFADLTSTVLFGWNALPMYIDVDFTAPKVTSLNEMIENGTVKFDPAIQKSKMQYAMLADFGPLVGAPCAVSIAPNSAKAFNFYAFNGITLNYCKARSDGTAIGGNNGSVENKTPDARSYCGGCSLNFVGVTSGAAMMTANALPINPIKLGIYFFRSIQRFVQAKKDKVNIPISADVNLQKVAETYQKHGGSIPEHCVEQLGAGVGCYQSICVAKAADAFEKYTGKKVLDIETASTTSSSITKSVVIKSAFCDGDVQMKFNCSDDGKRFSTFERFGGLYGRTKACRDAIGQNFWGR
ncbi:hypothetical protein B9G69_009715 [Bdellovibrio sp. SKB1291214]|uniref:hypothetical protein n=1 Tax=Bdellovibrio sp. SKB1291214 TaxID=1732569 RepID=UPI000B51C3C3|nr:hypothetical protein [Bdellovibrio sp. SKB1291214]UYL07322.1 hypothetical protein B9G69_009715 [Bdellovibrio sp. SKB1291214]